jgi:indole-3-glycerol phosphate synthase
MNTLESICANRKKQVEENRSLYPIALLEKSPYFNAEVVSLAHYLTRQGSSGVIAEFKRKSPSKGMINAYADVKQTTISYMQGGAAALSILTETDHFGGKDADLTEARKANYCPILRKDFIVDAYQIVEARSIGADAVLLIAAVHSKDDLKSLHLSARDLGLEVLIEVHSAEELDKLPAGDFILGVNNRDLKTMEVDLQTSIQLASQIGAGQTKISESGIHSPKDLMTLREAGYQGFLIGEAFMRTEEPGLELARFVSSSKSMA